MNPKPPTPPQALSSHVRTVDKHNRRSFEHVFRTARVFTSRLPKTKNIFLNTIMKNKSPVKANKQGEKAAKQGGSPIKKAKAALNASNASPKSPKSPKKPNGMQNGANKQKGKKDQQKQQSPKEKKVPVMNEANDSGDSDAEQLPVPKFAGTAALDKPESTGKQGKKNKKAPQDSDKVVPAKKAKTEKQPAKTDKKNAESKESEGKKKGENKGKPNLLKKLQGFVNEKNMEKLKEQLPVIQDEIKKLLPEQNSLTATASTRLKKLQNFEKKITTGDLATPTTPSKKANGLPKVPKGAKKIMKKMEQNEDDEEEETWQEMVAKAGSDDEETEDEEDEEEDEPAPKKGKQLSVVQKAKDKTLGKPQKKKRYVLFVGNLNFETTEEDIKKHFAKAGNVISVRMMKDRKTDKFKGCCHIELDNPQSYEKALSLHHTQIDRRQINVMVSENKKGGSPQGGKKKNSAKVKDMKLKGMKKKGLLAGGQTKSQKRNARRRKAAAAKEKSE